MKIDIKICIIFYIVVGFSSGLVSGPDERFKPTKVVKVSLQKKYKNAESKAIKIGGALILFLASCYVLKKTEFFGFFSHSKMLDPAEKFENDFKGAPENRLCVKLAPNGGARLGFKKSDKKRYSILDISVEENFLVECTKEDEESYKANLKQDKEDFTAFVKGLVGSGYVYFENGWFIISDSDTSKHGSAKGKVIFSDGTNRKSCGKFEALSYKREINKHPLLFRISGDNKVYGSLPKDEIVSSLRDDYEIDIFPRSEKGGRSPSSHYPSIT